jgi:arylsulfatase A-like enzyme
MRRIWLRAGLAVVLLVAACSSSPAHRSATGSGSIASSSAVPGSARAAATGKPNVLFVLTDDMRIDDLQFMPNVKALIGDQGTTFDNYFDNVTLCCPARTSILRGQYSHNTGVLSNGGKNGGFEMAYSSKVEQSTIATAMHDAGYTTGLFGKYLNGYPNTASDSYIPPGWDQWSSSSKGKPYNEFDYTLNENGQQVDYGKAPEDYGTDVYMRQTRDFISKAAQGSAPFFAYLAVYAPHEPSTPAPQDTKAFPGLQAPRDPSYNEADVSDKPHYIQALPQLSSTTQALIDGHYKKRAQSLQAVDRGVAGLVQQLKSSGQYDNTEIIFTSDNGFHLGQHRMPSGKQTAYETDIHLPLLVTGPGVSVGAHVTAITGNIDIAPTVAAFGGAQLTDNPDGRSLVPLLANANSSDPWRQVFLLEHWDAGTDYADRSGATQLEPDDLDQASSDSSSSGGTTTTVATGPLKASAIPEYQGLRVATFTYVEYVTGERELYDLSQDPDEINNLAASASPALLDAFHQRLDSLRKCAGDSCRSAENAPLVLPS